jgi:hypothetical protein
MQAGHTSLQEQQRPIRIEGIVGVGIGSMPQAHQPAAFHVAGSQLGGDAEGLKQSQIERCSTGEGRLQVFDYLMPRRSFHMLNIRHYLIIVWLDDESR